MARAELHSSTVSQSLVILAGGYAMNEELRPLIARIEKLERQNRLYRRATLALLLAAAIVAVMGQNLSSAPSTLEAQSFVLKDASGKERAKLEMLDGGPALMLLDERGQIRTQLDALYGGASLKLKDKDGFARTMLDDGGSIVSGSLLIADRKGNLRARLNADGDAPSLRFLDEHGHPRADFSDDPDATASIRVFNDNGSVVWSAP